MYNLSFSLWMAFFIPLPLPDINISCVTDASVNTDTPSVSKIEITSQHTYKYSQQCYENNYFYGSNFSLEIINSVFLYVNISLAVQYPFALCCCCKAARILIDVVCVLWCADDIW